jgi:hypothetical protein
MTARANPRHETPRGDGPSDASRRPNEGAGVTTWIQESLMTDLAADIATWNAETLRQRRASTYHQRAQQCRGRRSPCAPDRRARGRAALGRRHPASGC